jgi:hypothetical protein
MNGRHRLIAILVSLVVCVGSAWAQPTGRPAVQLGVSNGFILTPNPGEFYSTPIATELSAGLLRPFSIPAEAMLQITLAPFLPRDTSFERSLLTLVELSAGTRFNPDFFANTPAFISIHAGGGIYIRQTQGVRAAGSTRRPTALVRFGSGFSVPPWEYQLSITSRVLFDLRAVFALLPAVGFRYQFPLGESP